VNGRRVSGAGHFTKGEKMRTAAFVAFCSAVLLSGCAAPTQTTVVEADLQLAPRSIKLTAVGYGSASSFESYSTGQRKLLAMRASKLDAYRALAEQVHGVRITGGSTVSSMMMQSESFRVYIDAYIRGARIVQVTPMPDGNYETTIELDFDPQLVRNFVAAPRGAYYNPVYGVRGSVGSGGLYGSSFYFADQ
jgi:hypothetical protein